MNLIELVEQILPSLQDETIKQSLSTLLKEFEEISVPTAIDLEEAYMEAEVRGIEISSAEAREIIEAAAEDINYNLTDRAVENSCNEFFRAMSD